VQNAEAETESRAKKRLRVCIKDNGARRGNVFFRRAGGCAVGEKDIRDRLRGATGEQGIAGSPGADGAQGEAGVPGATGPQGPAGTDWLASVDPIHPTNTTVASGSNLIFDSVIYSLGNISYNAVSGVITFNETGQ
jgi:hypothetical protein